MKMLKILGITMVFLSNFGATVHASEEEDNTERQRNFLENAIQSEQSEHPDQNLMGPQILNFDPPVHLLLISLLVSTLQVREKINKFSSRFEAQNSVLQTRIFQPLQELSSNLEAANLSEEVKNELQEEIYKIQEQYQQIRGSLQQQDLEKLDDEVDTRLKERKEQILKLMFRVIDLQKRFNGLF